MFNFDNELQEQEETSLGFSLENSQYLKRIEEDFLTEIENGKFIKNLLFILMFKSFNIFICLFCIQLNIHIFLAFFAGCSVGSIPGLKMLSQSTKIDRDNPYTSIMNGRIGFSLLQIVASALISFCTVAEWQQISNFSMKSYNYFTEDVEHYEGKLPKGVDPQLFVLLTLLSGGFCGVIICKWLFSSRY